MPEIRKYRPDDLAMLYRICLETGEAGKDATDLYKDGKLLGHVYAAPYGVLSPETVFIAEDAEGAGGYIVGPVDTRSFDARMEREWWPKLRPSLADPKDKPYKTWSRDERMSYLIHHPARTTEPILDRYPSHLHINLLPRLQGQGLGVKLIDRWLAEMKALGSPGAHLGVGTANARAVGFYKAYGFEEVERIRDVIWYGVRL
jgi:ribosomal protein S18 acetylase RimI-like enzyme